MSHKKVDEEPSSPPTSTFPITPSPSKDDGYPSTPVPKHSPSTTLNLLELASASLSSTFIAARSIQRFSGNVSYGRNGGRLTHQKSRSEDFTSTVARLKLDGTIVTDADGAAQKIICSSLRSVCPSLCILAEESRQEVEDGCTNAMRDFFDIMTPNSRRRLLTDEILEEDAISAQIREEVYERLRESENKSNLNDNEKEFNNLQLEVEASRVIAVVDPLDGSSAYARGHYEAVTILVGIVVDNVPIFGVICKPFGQIGFQSYRNTGCFAVYGGSLLHGAFVVGGKELETSRMARLGISSKTLLSERKAIISKSRSGGVVQKCISSLSELGLLSRTPVFVTGAGLKALRLLLGSGDETLWFFPKPGTSLWDVAAADALLRVIGGKLSDKYGKDLDYSKPRVEAQNLDGIIACNDDSLHKKCMQLFFEENWDDE
eukprot:CAMPEP_0184870244 /NCGR_PEP_ID=MMETSP0580-20130426/36890_1 /TAXON_ID=1118495 /ORGANISM="Dactyliosolen fragilissimus" /LENGTH=431 /DNA_ID=CAMNT_0027372225 /DNA_START=184 /DNA_END=1479 /DNA_ORIENTATION=+